MEPNRHGLGWYGLGYCRVAGRQGRKQVQHLARCNLQIAYYIKT